MPPGTLDRVQLHGSPGRSSVSHSSPSSARSSSPRSLIRRWVTRPIDRPRRGRAPRARRFDSTRRSGSPGRQSSPSLALDIDAMRGRIRQQLRRLRTLTRGGRAERGGGARRCARSSSPTSGRSPDGWTVAAQPCARPKAWSRATATTCSSPSRATSRLIVVDIAGHGATEGILALRCKEVLRTALTSGVAAGRRAASPPPSSSATWATRCS